MPAFAHLFVHATLLRPNLRDAHCITGNDAHAARSPPHQLTASQSLDQLQFFMPVLISPRLAPSHKRRKGRRTPSPNTTHETKKRNDPPENQRKKKRKTAPLTETRRKTTLLVLGGCPRDTERIHANRNRTNQTAIIKPILYLQKH